MDIQRPATNKKRNRRIAALVGAGAALSVLTFAAWSVAQRPPGVDGDLVYSGVVRQGEFVHQVTGSGSLWAPEIRSVTNQSEGVIERVHVLAGHVVEPDDVLVELSSPTLIQELADAEAELEAAEADEFVRQAESEDELLNLQNALADAVGQYEEAQIQANAERALDAENATNDLNLLSAVNRAEQARRRVEIAQAKVDSYPEMRAARDAAAQSKLDQQRRKVERLRERVDELEVRAGFSGVVQEVSVEEGERLSAGQEVARVVNPEILIARVRVSERDAPLIAHGQAVRLEMGREVIAGKVTRIDPAVTDRLVTVDVDLVGEPTRQLMPDLTVTARIEIQRVADTLVLDKPAGLREDAESIELFRFVDDDDRRAERVRVEVGRFSASEVEILNGLEPGDRVILANMTDWLEEPVIRIR